MASPRKFKAYKAMQNRLRSVIKNGGKHKNLTMISILCLASLNITACDFINNKLYPDFRANEVKSEVDKPPFAREISIEKVRDVAEATHIEDPAFTVNDVVIKEPKVVLDTDVPNSLPPVKMAEVKGLNVTPPIDTKISQDNLVDTPAYKQAAVTTQMRQPTKTDYTDNTISDRLAKLESDVVQIQSTIAKMAPSITKLIGIERDLDNLTFQLEDIIKSGTLNKNMALKQPEAIVTLPDPATIKPLKKPVSQSKDSVKKDSAPPVKASIEEKPKASVIQPTTPVEEVKSAVNTAPQKALSAEEINQAANKETKEKPVSSVTNSVIKKIRIGDHTGKTRIVVETDSYMEYEVAIDNQEQLMMMAVPTTRLSVDPSKAAKASSLIQAISKNEIDGNMVLAFDLKKTSSIISTERIPPSKDNSNHRIVIDLKR